MPQGTSPYETHSSPAGPGRSAWTSPWGRRTVLTREPSGLSSASTFQGPLLGTQLQGLVHTDPSGITVTWLAFWRLGGSEYSLTLPLGVIMASALMWLRAAHSDPSGAAARESR